MSVSLTACVALQGSSFYRTLKLDEGVKKGVVTLLHSQEDVEREKNKLAKEFEVDALSLSRCWKHTKSFFEVHCYFARPTTIPIICHEPTRRRIAGP